jgi:RNA polymerase sigma-70 factor (sigma-E family)
VVPFDRFSCLGKRSRNETAGPGVSIVVGKLNCIVDADRGEGTQFPAARSGESTSRSDEVISLRTDAATPPDGRTVKPDHGATPSDEARRMEFSGFYADHYAGLVRLATLLSGSVDVAPDLVQDCFVQLHGRWTSVREPLPYVRRSVVHACASHHRRLARGRRLPPPETRELELDADELEDALAKLPSRQRAAVVLRYYGDLSEADIAHTLRCRPATVRSLIHRALAELRKAIDP